MKIRSACIERRWEADEHPEPTCPLCGKPLEPEDKLVHKWCADYEKEEG